MAIRYNSNYDVTIPFSDTCGQVSLTANVEQVYTVPGSAGTQYSARFGYTANSNVFVRNAGTSPAIPASNSIGSQQFSEFRPGDDGSQRYVQAGDAIRFITPDATAYVGISLRQLPG